MNATTVDLSLSTFWWATFRTTIGGIKLHTQLDLSTAIPELILVTPASVHDVIFFDLLRFEPNYMYAMDSGYVN